MRHEELLDVRLSVVPLDVLILRVLEDNICIEYCICNHAQSDDHSDEVEGEQDSAYEQHECTPSFGTVHETEVNSDYFRNLFEMGLEAAQQAGKYDQIAC